MKQIIYFSLCCVLIAAATQDTMAQFNMVTNSGQTITTCSGTFSDSGAGTTHYGNNEDNTVTFCSTNGTDLLRFNFGVGSNTTIERIAPGDTLYIYDGSSATGVPIAKLTGNSLNSNRIPYLGETSSAIFLSPSPCITFRFVSNGATNDDGWEAGISCVPSVACGNNPPASDLFGGAPLICDLSGYCGTTSANFGADYPGNLFGNVGGSCPTLFGGTLQNNSWLRFQAGSANVDFNVNVTGCVDGIQIAIFAFDGSTFTRMSPCAISDGGTIGSFSLTGTGLTPGEIYYIMVDGNAGDVCNYTLAVTSGVTALNAGTDQTICLGASANLSATGPAGSTFEWTAVGGGFGPAAGANQTVSPNTTTDYIVTASGACESQTDTVRVTVDACALCAISNLAAGAQTACVAASNTYTQEVTVTYSNAPASGTLVVNGQSFAIGTSPQTVTLTNLTANGAAVNVTASFSADAACTRTTNSLFVAPAACSIVPPSCTPNNGTWD
jgi:hypothetical protein